MYADQSDLTAGMAGEQYWWAEGRHAKFV